jgi:hypothetical protein
MGCGASKAPCDDKATARNSPAKQVHVASADGVDLRVPAKDTTSIKDGSAGTDAPSAGSPRPGLLKVDGTSDNGSGESKRTSRASSIVSKTSVTTADWHTLERHRRSSGGFEDDEPGQSSLQRRIDLKVTAAAKRTPGLMKMTSENDDPPLTPNSRRKTETWVSNLSVSPPTPNGLTPRMDDEYVPPRSMLGDGRPPLGSSVVEEAPTGVHNFQMCVSSFT